MLVTLAPVIWLTPFFLGSIEQGVPLQPFPWHVILIPKLGFLVWNELLVSR